VALEVALGPGEPKNRARQWVAHDTPISQDDVKGPPRKKEETEVYKKEAWNGKKKVLGN